MSPCANGPCLKARHTVDNMVAAEPIKIFAYTNPISTEISVRGELLKVPKQCC